MAVRPETACLVLLESNMVHVAQEWLRDQENEENNTYDRMGVVHLRIILVQIKETIKEGRLTRFCSLAMVRPRANAMINMICVRIWKMAWNQTRLGKLKSRIAMAPKGKSTANESPARTPCAISLI